MGQVEALSAKDSTLLNGIVQSVGPLTQWPVHTMTQMLSNHLMYQQRMNLTFFLLGNACPPDLLAEWYIQRGMLRDDSARRQVADFIKQHKAGQLQRFKTYMLPMRISRRTEITAAEQKAMFARGERLVPASYGNPIDPKIPAAASLVLPIITPDNMAAEGHRWDFAYNLLMGSLMYTPAALVGTRPVAKPAEFKIVPVADPDAFEDDDFLYADGQSPDGFDEELFPRHRRKQKTVSDVEVTTQHAVEEAISYALVPK
jgi:hypothetical protein